MSKRWLADIAWSTLADDVSYVETGTYDVYVTPLNPNEPGAGGETKDIGDYLIDYTGYIFEITATGIDGDDHIIRVEDLLGREREGPCSNQTAYVYRPKFNAIVLSQAQIRRLGDTARDNINNVEKAIIWDYRGVSLGDGDSYLDNITRLKAGTGLAFSQGLSDTGPWQGGTGSVIYFDSSDIEHNSLTGIQGGMSGATGEYYHLDEEDYNKLVDWYDNRNSAGRLWGGEIVNNGDGTITVREGGGLIKSEEAAFETIPTALNQGQGSELSYVTWSETTLNPTDNAYNFIYYDGSLGAITYSTSYYDVSYTRDFTVGRIYKYQGNVTARLCGTNLWNYDRRIQHFGEERFPVERASGMVIGNPSSLYISVTSGVLWAELVNRFSVNSFDSSTSQTFSAWYKDGTDSFNRTTGNSQIDNVYFNDGNVLSELTVNRYGVHWVYMLHDSTVHVVYGRGDYKEKEATEAIPPTDIPGLLSAYGTLVGKLIVQKNSTSFYSVESPFTIRFNSSGVTDHGDLSGLGDDDHSIYLLLGGRSGQTIDDTISITESLQVGGTGASYVQGSLGVGGIISPTEVIEVDGNIATNNDIIFTGPDVNWELGKYGTDAIAVVNPTSTEFYWEWNKNYIRGQATDDSEDDRVLFNIGTQGTTKGNWYLEGYESGSPLDYQILGSEDGVFQTYTDDTGDSWKTSLNSSGYTVEFNNTSKLTVLQDFTRIDNEVLQLISRSTYPSSSIEGYIIRLKDHSSDADGLYIHNGSSWQAITTW